MDIKEESREIEKKPPSVHVFKEKNVFFNFIF